MYTALSIAGSDCSGGAGIQADLKTMAAHGVYGMSAITALTAQNTLGVCDIMNVTPQFLDHQLQAVFCDIFPDAVKIGMVSDSNLIDIIAAALRKFKPKHVVLDPVMVATSGSKLLQDSALQNLTTLLLPLCTVCTPNIPEAEILVGGSICTMQDMEQAAQKITATYGCSTLIKGGHQKNEANDVLCQAGTLTWFYGRRIDNDNTHGTGCTLSSAIASNLAKGENLPIAIEHAKTYLSEALEFGLNLGHGSGPLNHCYKISQLEEQK